jgi:hypothetical protein
MISDLLGSNGFLLVVSGVPKDRGASIFRVNQTTSASTSAVRI